MNPFYGYVFANNMNRNFNNTGAYNNNFNYTGNTGFNVQNYGNNIGMNEFIQKSNNK